MIIIAILILSIIQDINAIWCFYCSEFSNRTQLCDNIENVVFHESENSLCVIGYINDTIMFRVSS